MRLLETYTVQFLKSGTSKQYPSKVAAHEAAAEYCGNDRYVKPFRDEDTWLYGPGDGSTSCMVQQDFDFVDEEVAS